MLLTTRPSLERFLLTIWMDWAEPQLSFAGGFRATAEIRVKSHGTEKSILHSAWGGGGVCGGTAFKFGIIDSKSLNMKVYSSLVPKAASLSAQLQAEVQGRAAFCSTECGWNRNRWIFHRVELFFSLCSHRLWPHLFHNLLHNVTDLYGQNIFTGTEER